MAYENEMFKVVDQFFVEGVMPYGRTNAEAGEYLRKFKPFQKKNFEGYVKKFSHHMEFAQQLNMDNIQVEQQNQLAVQLKAAFLQSQKSFLKLCQRNIEFFQFQNKKVNHEKISVADIKEITVALRTAMNSAMRDIDLLETAYKELKASIDTEFAKEYEIQKVETAEKNAKREAEIREFEKKQAIKEEKKIQRKEKKLPPKVIFDQCSDDEYEDIEDLEDSED